MSRYHFACLMAGLDAREGVVLPVSAVTDVDMDRESKPRSPGRAASTFKHRAISPVFR